ncbi:MAG: hypothetical protein DMG13_12810 [Acidobacteria bacterium]|nr:MAG: hypothetical protein DMG13_12810 [Acidobacteriota bacterium]
MNRREFLTVLGGATALPAVSVINVHPAFAASETTSLYIKGLVMLDFENPEVLRLGFPKAPGHKATLSIVPQNGSRRTLTIKGRGAVEAPASAPGSPRIFVPELVRMREFYGNSVKSRVDQCPSVISIPSAVIRSVTTEQVSKARYTFVRGDNGQEVDTFRPRQIADTIRIDLSSAGTLKLDDGKINIPLDTARELRVEYSPERPDSVDPYADHFNHYFAYVERPAALDFDVVPRKLGAGSAPSPNVGHRFMMTDNIAFCYVIAVP